MNTREFASWCKTLPDRRFDEAQQLCFAAVTTFEDISLDVLRDGVRRALEDCWQARLRKPVLHALELMKAEMAALHGEEPTS